MKELTSFLVAIALAVTLLFSASCKKADTLQKALQLEASYVIEVPSQYDHNTQLSRFYKNYRNSLSFRDQTMDFEFPHLVDKLRAGKQYTVEVYRPARTLSHQECVDFLQSKKALFVGGEGLEVFWELRNKEKIRDGVWYASYIKTPDSKPAACFSLGQFIGHQLDVSHASDRIVCFRESKD